MNGLLAFTDDLILLVSSEQGLQQAPDRFSAACYHAVMKVSTTKTEVLCLPRNPNQSVLQVSGKTLQQVEKFKFLGVALELH